jgi:hypothetical protein
VARYGNAFKDRAVARLLPPESATLDDVAREYGVGVATLERWRSAALAEPPEAHPNRRACFPGGAARLNVRTGEPMRQGHRTRQSGMQAVAGGLAACACLALTPTSWAQPMSAGIITACVQKDSDRVRLVPESGTCRPNETRLQWNVAGPKGEPGAQGPAGMGPEVLSLDNPGLVIPVQFPGLQPVPNGTLLVDVAAGQRLQVHAQLELQPPGDNASAVYPVDIAIYSRGVASPHPIATLPIGPPIGLPGIHNRREQVQGVIAGLAPGTYEVGIAGLGYPDPNASYPGGNRFVAVHRIRITVTVLEPY